MHPLGHRYGGSQLAQVWVPIGLKDVQAVHRSTQDDHDKSVLAGCAGEGDWRDKGSSRCQTARHRSALEEQSPTEHYVISG